MPPAINSFQVITIQQVAVQETSPVVMYLTAVLMQVLIIKEFLIQI
jgi:hypothetical protein